MTYPLDLEPRSLAMAFTCAMWPSMEPRERINLDLSATAGTSGGRTASATDTEGKLSAGESPAESTTLSSGVEAEAATLRGRRNTKARHALNEMIAVESEEIPTCISSCVNSQSESSASPTQFTYTQTQN